MNKKQYEEIKGILSGMKKKQDSIHRMLKRMSDTLDYVESHTDYFVRADLDKRKLGKNKWREEYKKICGD